MVEDSVSGKTLGVHLERLRQIARVDIPRAANDYAAVSDAIAETESTASKVFNEEVDFGIGKIESPWIYIRDTLWAGAGDTSAHLWDVGEVLDSAVVEWAEYDDEAGAELEQWRDEIEDSSKEGIHEWQGDYEYPDRPDWVPPGSEPDN